MLINKRYFFELCEYAEAPLMTSEKQAAGHASDMTGRFVNPRKFKMLAAERALPLTKHQEEIMDMLERIEYLRRTNKRG